jgi:hypothetical protein
MPEPTPSDWPADLAGARYLGLAQVVHRFDQATRDLEKGLAETSVTFNAIRTQLDALSELGEVEALELQMEMDRRSKFIETLSNIMKKISTTADGIVQNLK